VNDNPRHSPVNSENLQQLLANAALERGFDGAQWVPAPDLTRDSQAFAAWNAAGMQAGMDYLPKSAARRSDLSSSLLASPTGAGSALVLLVSHDHADPGVPSGGVRVGQVARFAWSRDYHAVIQPELDFLLALANQHGIIARGFVDHGPLFERSLASRAGLGWRGRQSQIISERFGAYTSLALLLTNLEVASSASDDHSDHPDRCGRCHTCIPACPTNAITSERSIDARRCLAYYTVEHHGPIPLEFRAALGEHLFGCDDCLAVCPWSLAAGRRGRRSGLLQPLPELAHPDLVPMFTSSSRAYERLMAGSVFVRARRRGMARNAAIVLGNLHNPAHLWLLELGLSDPGSEVREASAWAVAQMVAEKPARKLLERALYSEDLAVRATAQRGLEDMVL
jgi:epoxyqueuosine reductase